MESFCKKCCQPKLVESDALGVRFQHAQPDRLRLTINFQVLTNNY
jgi:hypothetical protein